METRLRPDKAVGEAACLSCRYPMNIILMISALGRSISSMDDSVLILKKTGLPKEVANITLISSQFRGTKAAFPHDQSSRPPRDQTGLAVLDMSHLFQRDPVKVYIE